ncbi:MAG: hypothetical protein K2L51_00235 [Clostridiales bacterium]|nr:hypothetical protein [Clostridiales bacterium]
MNAQKNASPTIVRILYGFGGLTIVTEVAFLLQFLALFAHVNMWSLLIGVTAGLALPVFVMPLCYDWINGNTAIVTGRYHLPMAIAGFAGALASVLMLGVGATHAVAQAFAVAGLAFLYSSAMQIYMYAYYAVGQRFDPSGTALRYKSAVSLAAVAVAAILVLVFFDGSREGVRAVTATAGIAAVFGTLAAYFSTVRSMPAFIRLEPRHKRGVKEIYARFVAPLRRRAVKLLAVSTFLLSAATAFLASGAPLCVFGYVFGISRGVKPAVLVTGGLIAVAGALAQGAHGKRKSGGGAAIALASVLLALAAGVAVILYLSVPQLYKAIVLFAFAAAAGVTLGLMFAGESRNKAYVTRLVDCTPGKYYCLRNGIVALGGAVGLALSCAMRIVAEYIGGRVAAIALCALFGALVLASALCGRVGHADKLWS